MSKNMTPTVEEFEAWTAEDEAKALQESAEAMNVKHIIRDGTQGSCVQAAVGPVD